MTLLSRVLDARSVASRAEWGRSDDGDGVDIAARTAPADLRAMIAAAGLRGRGGAGFPTGRKWQTVATNATGGIDPPTLVVNGAEGEPGCFKDRTLMRTNPHRVVDGALIAARATGATTVILALKRTSTTEIAAMESALADATADGLTEGIATSVFAGPTEYLLGEETALLEAIDGRPPFPRIAPPFRRGVEEVASPGSSDHSRSAAREELAGPTTETSAPPTLVENVETIANLPGIVAHGVEWYRETGTAASPGTVLCTVSGSTLRDGVGEFAMGTPLHEVLEALGGVTPDQIRAVMIGVSSPVLRPEDLDVALTYEDLAAIGGGLGTAGFIVLGADDDLLAVAAGAARFLAVESCGQCTPCKEDGREIAERLEAALGAETRGAADLAVVDERLRTVADGARCNLASQQQAVVGSILARFPEVVARAGHRARPGAPHPIAPIQDQVDGRFVLDHDEARKQPDWHLAAVDSGRAPADRLGPGQPAER